MSYAVKQDMIDRFALAELIQLTDHDELRQVKTAKADVALGDAHADVGRFTVDGDLTVLDQLLHLAARADAGLGQHLVQLGCFRFGTQHALARIDQFIVRVGSYFGVVVARDHLGEQRAGIDRVIVTAADYDHLELLSPDDPLRGVYSVYTWLGWLQETLLEALMDEINE